MSDCKKPQRCNQPQSKVKVKKVCKPRVRKSEWDVLKPKIDFPHALRILGPKHFEAARNFIPSLMVFGMTAALGILYFTEFRTVLQYVPYYGGKYARPEDDD